MRKLLVALFFLTSPLLAADNVAITPGSGDTIAADDIGGAKHQRVKMEFGADGTATEVSAANSLPVIVSSIQVGGANISASNPIPVQSTGTTTVAGTVTANAGTNLNTSTLALESGGNLATLASVTASTTGVVTPSKMAFVGGNGSGNLTPFIICDSTAVINTASSGKAVVISSQTAKSTYICSWDVVVGGTTSFDLEYSTTSACATASTNMTGPYPFVANTGISKGSGVGMILKAASAAAVCINNTAAVQASGSITYTQF